MTDDPDGRPILLGTPVCRVVRDGLPVVDYLGRPVSDREALQALAAGCQPMNVFGNALRHDRI